MYAGGHWQWRPKSKGNSPVPDIMMLTADLALIKDPVYLKHVKHYAANQDALTEDFANAWYKLMTRSMGPVSRCIGSNVPPARVSASRSGSRHLGARCRRRTVHCCRWPLLLLL